MPMDTQEAKDIVANWLKDKTPEDKIVMALYVLQDEGLIEEALGPKAQELFPEEFGDA